MYKIIPSILAADFTKLGEEIQETKNAGPEQLHIDVMDDIFAPNISFGIPVLQSIRKRTDQFLDVHLMVVNPARYICDFSSAGADGITFHVEAAENPQRVIDRIRQHGKKVGMAVNPETPLEKVGPYLDQIDTLLIMTVHPGFGGQKFLPEANMKLREAKWLVGNRNIDIRVDGGINKDTIAEAAEFGADTFVAGSAVFNGNIGKNIRELDAIARIEGGNNDLYRDCKEA